MLDTPQPLAKALRTHPKTAGGIHPSTARRWHTKGVKRADGVLVKLNISFVGARLFLAHADLDKFLSELNSDTGADTAQTPPRSPAARQKASERANAAALEAIGS